MWNEVRRSHCDWCSAGGSESSCDSYTGFPWSCPLWEKAGSCCMLTLTTEITYEEASVRHNFIVLQVFLHQTHPVSENPADGWCALGDTSQYLLEGKTPVSSLSEFSTKNVGQPNTDVLYSGEIKCLGISAYSESVRKQYANRILLISSLEIPTQQKFSVSLINNRYSKYINKIFISGLFVTIFQSVLNVKF